MSDFDIDREYDLIINQGNSFLMMNDEQKRRTLECVRDHLTHDGKFVVQIANPDRWKQNPQGPILHLHETSTESEHVVINYSQEIDEEERVNHMTWFRERIDRETNKVTKHVWPIDFQYLTHEEALKLIRNAGFEISAEYGNFDKSAYTSSSNRMVFECVKT
jgi:SAM-dependent methyltransferase